MPLREDGQTSAAVLEESQGIVHTRQNYRLPLTCGGLGLKGATMDGTQTLAMIIVIAIVVLSAPLWVARQRVERDAWRRVFRSWRRAWHRDDPSRR